MTKTVIVDHHHDKDAEVYRLTFALVSVVQDEEGVLHQVATAPEEIVWASDDEQWEGKSDAAIAEEQRAIVKKVLSDRADAAAVTQEHRFDALTDLGGAGEEL